MVPTSSLTSLDVLFYGIHVIASLSNEVPDTEVCWWHAFASLTDILLYMWVTYFLLDSVSHLPSDWGII